MTVAAIARVLRPESNSLSPSHDPTLPEGASMLSGVAVVVCMTPLDVVSTRMYNQGVDSKGRGLIYSGLWDCIRQITKKEGLLGFYKGSTASLLRTGPHTVLSLTFWNEFRKLYDYYGSEIPEAEVAQL
ncbi:Solute carrier family 25 member 35 [Araneus ventricosus]|uniref:Solute carrier family 25 member 35 n=1 Tax=Araneus ventricosus TaxID=182803 RepID=A0A4Y2L6U3_ARAVE|nr:Solute carrier family 25 member 35 [Araneus ventricosus]